MRKPPKGLERGNPKGLKEEARRAVVRGILQRGGVLQRGILQRDGYYREMGTIERERGQPHEGL